MGIATTLRYAQRLGIGSVPSVPSLALGSGEVTLLSMVAAFGAFANKGVLVEPMLVTRVETTDGRVLHQVAPKSARAVSEATAYLISSMLSDVVNAGTGWQARNVGFTLPAAGKTGTTNDYHDAWFVGYTPTLVSGVWVGYDKPRTITANGYAGELAVPMWGRFMKAATRADTAAPFRAPSGIASVEICRLSGKLASDACRGASVEDANGRIRPMAYTEQFVSGTEPIERCPLHGFNLLHALAEATAVPAPQAHAPVATAVSTPAASGGAPVEVEADPSPAARAEPEPKPRRRGFWSRLFGRGGDSDDKQERRSGR